MTATDKKTGYVPYGGARALWSCKAREILFDGPAGTGKTRAAVEKGVLQAMKYPGCRILFVRKTRASLTESVLVTLETHVALGQSWIRGQKRSHRQAYDLPNGSTIVCGGLDNVDRIMSTEYDAVYLFEATEATEDDWEKCITRLRNGIMPYQQAIADCNPSSPKHWLKARADADKMKRIMSRHEDNPKVTKDYLASLAALSGHRRDRLYKGKWCAAEGLIYDMWDEAVFVQRPADFVPTRAIIGIDEGYTNPCSKHLYLVDNDGRLYIQRENYETQQLEAQVIEVVQEWASQYREILEAVIVDPSAAKLIGSLENVGLPVEPAKNSVYDGIKAVQERMKVAGDGNPRLFVDPECTNLVEEVSGYTWKENRDGSHEDKPTKKNDHCFIAGTMILTPTGEQPIESLYVGDMVITTNGPEPIKAAGITNPAAECFRVDLSNGRYLVGTAGHPVLANDQWIPIDELRYGDILYSKEELPCKRSDTSTEGVTSGIQNQTMNQTGGTSRIMEDCCTEMPMQHFTDQYQKDTTSTTLMATAATTNQKTLSAYHQQNTHKGIQGHAQTSGANTLNVSGHPRQSGTDQTAAKSGTVNTESSCGKTDRHTYSTASTAESTSAQRHCKAQSSAQTTVNRHGAERQELMMSRGNVKDAALHSKRTNTARQGSALCYVQGVTALPDKHTVYNLTIDGTPEYFASGVLVHNCMDELRYVCMYLAETDGAYEVFKL